VTPRRALFVSLAWVAVAVILQLLRQQGAPAVDTVWAEDGSIFFSQPLLEGPGALLQQYNGYIHVVPRLIGGAVSLIPPEAAAAAFAVVSAAIVGGLSIYVFVASRDILRSTVARAVLALLVAVPPPGGWETTANIANIQWNLLFPCFLAVVVRPRTRAHMVASAVIAGATALTAPIALLLAPVSVWGLFRWPRRAAVAVHGTFLVAAAVQLVISLLEGSTSSLESHLLDLPRLLALRVGAGTVLGERLLLELWPALGWALAVGGGAVLAAAAIGCWREEQGRRSVLLIALVASAAMFMAPVYLRGTTQLIPGVEGLSQIGARWVVGPGLLLATVLVALAERAASRPGAASKATVIAVAAALGTGVVTSFPSENQRSPGPRWSTSLNEAAERCAGRTRVAVPVTPAPYFLAVLPCDRLTASGSSVSALGRTETP